MDNNKLNDSKTRERALLYFTQPTHSTHDDIESTCSQYTHKPSTNGEAATGGVLYKIAFLEILQNSRVNTFVRASFLIRLLVLGLQLY